MLGSQKRPAISDPGSRAAALGGIAFGALTLIAIFVTNSPGGGYSVSEVTDYLAEGHILPVIVAFHLALISLLGLVALLVQLRDLLRQPHVASVVWGTGVAATACFAVGWGIAGGQVVAHLEGGAAISVPPAVTYLISEIGVVFIFGCGAVLLGLTLIVFALNAGEVMPGWLRWFTVACGVAGLAGLAFFTFFLLLIFSMVVGVWLLAANRQGTAPAFASQPDAQKL
jgi:hypothetical protein